MSHIIIDSPLLLVGMILNDAKEFFYVKGRKFDLQ